MVFHENRLPADDSHEISSLIFRKLGKMSKNMSAAAAVIGALSVNTILIAILPGDTLYKCELLALTKGVFNSNRI